MLERKIRLRISSATANAILEDKENPIENSIISFLKPNFLNRDTIKIWNSIQANRTARICELQEQLSEKLAHLKREEKKSFIDASDRMSNVIYTEYIRTPLQRALEERTRAPDD
jgi:hypothetical protein